jgi:hypothetical protein
LIRLSALNRYAVAVNVAATTRIGMRFDFIAVTGFRNRNLKVDADDSA